MGVAEAQSRISSAEFAEWMAFDRLEPFGEQRADLRAGIIASTVATVGAQGRRQFAAKDFMPTFGESQRRQSPEDMQAIMMQASRIAAAASAKKKPKERPAPKRDR